MSGGYQERIAEAMDPIYWRRRNDPEAPALKAHAADLIRKADLILAALKADGWRPPDELCWAFCEHHEYADDLNSDEHQANCLSNPHAARRLAEREGQWDSQGISGWGP